jgi:hypothetical protein
MTSLLFMEGAHDGDGNLLIIDLELDRQPTYFNLKALGDRMCTTAGGHDVLGQAFGPVGTSQGREQGRSLYSSAIFATMDAIQNVHPLYTMATLILHRTLSPPATDIHGLFRRYLRPLSPLNFPSAFYRMPAIRSSLRFHGIPDCPLPYHAISGAPQNLLPREFFGTVCYHVPPSKPTVRCRTGPSRP